MATNNLQANLDNSNSALTGLYRGQVEDNRDPKKLGRIKVRVPQMHGIPPQKDISQTSDSNGNNPANSKDSESAKPLDKGASNSESPAVSDHIDTSGIPWASPITATGTGHDHGSIMVPHIGDYVFIMYENGDRQAPVYLGGCYGIPTQQKQFGYIDESDSTNNRGAFKSPAGAVECPMEVYDPHGDPSMRILYKSPKGFVIGVNETDGDEHLLLHAFDNQAISITNRSDRNGSSIDINGRKGQSISVVTRDDGVGEITVHSPDRKTKIELRNENVIVTKGSQVSMKFTDDTIEINSPKLVLNSTNIAFTASDFNINSNMNVSGDIDLQGNQHTSGNNTTSGSNSNHHSH